MNSNSQSLEQEKQTLEDYVRQRQNFMQHMVEADGKRHGITRVYMYEVAMYLPGYISGYIIL